MAFTKEIARIFVSIFARREQLKTDLRAAEQDVKQSAQKMGATAEKEVGSVFKEVGHDIKNTFAPIRTFVNAITSTVAIATRLLGLFGLIAGAIGGLVALYDKVAKSAERSLKAAQDEYRAREDIRLAVSGLADLQDPERSVRAAQDEARSAIDKVNSQYNLNDLVDRELKLRDRILVLTGKSDVRTGAMGRTRGEVRAEKEAELRDVLALQKERIDRLAEIDRNMRLKIARAEQAESDRRAEKDRRNAEETAEIIDDINRDAASAAFDSLEAAEEAGRRWRDELRRSRDDDEKERARAEEAGFAARIRGEEEVASVRRRSQLFSPGGGSAQYDKRRLVYMFAAVRDALEAGR